MEQLIQQFKSQSHLPFFRSTLCLNTCLVQNTLNRHYQEWWRRIIQCYSLRHRWSREWFSNSENIPALSGSASRWRRSGSTDAKSSASARASFWWWITSFRRVKNEFDKESTCASRWRIWILASVREPCSPWPFLWEMKWIEFRDLEENYKLPLPQMMSKVHKLVNFSTSISVFSLVEHRVSIFRHKMALCSLKPSKKSSMMWKWKAGVNSLRLDFHFAPAPFGY